ncbi:mCG145462, partial [Mus musculus]
WGRCPPGQAEMLHTAGARQTPETTTLEGVADEWGRSPEEQLEAGPALGQEAGRQSCNLLGSDLQAVPTGTRSATLRDAKRDGDRKKPICSCKVASKDDGRLARGPGPTPSGSSTPETAKALDSCIPARTQDGQRNPHLSRKARTVSTRATATATSCSSPRETLGKRAL